MLLQETNPRHRVGARPVSSLSPVIKLLESLLRYSFPRNIILVPFRTAGVLGDLDAESVGHKRVPRMWRSGVRCNGWRRREGCELNQTGSPPGPHRHAPLFAHDELRIRVCRRQRPAIDRRSETPISRQLPVVSDVDA
jgi:hypothetical protein